MRGLPCGIVLRRNGQTAVRVGNVVGGKSKLVYAMFRHSCFKRRMYGLFVERNLLGCVVR